METSWGKNDGQFSFVNSRTDFLNRRQRNVHFNKLNILDLLEQWKKHVITLFMNY